jgi:hypothetical protein
MLTSAFLITGGSIFALLGFLHAAYTWADIRRPRRLVPEDPAVIAAMSNSSLRLSRGGTTMWRAWVGFNFSHSVGVLIFGLGCVAIGVWLQSLAPAKGFLLIPFGIGCIYLWLAIQYWFRVPAIGVAVGTSCLGAAWILY